MKELLKLADEVVKNKFEDECWWSNPDKNSKINQLAKEGIVLRTSVTQVEWTDKGVALYNKYIGG